MLLSALTPCQRDVAEGILDRLEYAFDDNKFNEEITNNLKFPSEWTSKNSLEFTRALRECDQRVLDYILDNDWGPISISNILDMMRGLQLPRRWLHDVQAWPDVLRKCLDLGQPVLLSKIRDFDKSHVDVLRQHPDLPEETLIDLFEVARQKIDLEARLFRAEPTIFVFLVFSFIMIIVTAIMLEENDKLRARPCPQTQPCPGLESYPLNQIGHHVVLRFINSVLQAINLWKRVLPFPSMP